MLKQGSEGAAVKRVQTLIGVKASGVFDARTAQRVKLFQRRHRLGVDGVVGPLTWGAMVAEAARQRKVDALWPRVSIVRIDLPQSDDLTELIEKGVSYGHLRTRADLAKILGLVFAQLDGSGVVLTTSGGMRSLRGTVTQSRSSTSLHYVGRAIDLGVYTGAVDPRVDPFLVAVDEDLKAARRFRVYARAEDVDHPLVEKRTFMALSRKKRRPVQVEGVPCVDITALFARMGLHGIAARRWAWDAPCSGNGLSGLEWWHFQWEEGLEEGLTAFGDELLCVHGYDRASASGPWAHAGAVWGGKFR